LASQVSSARNPHRLRARASRPKAEECLLIYVDCIACRDRLAAGQRNRRTVVGPSTLRRTRLRPYSLAAHRGFSIRENDSLACPLTARTDCGVIAGRCPSLASCFRACSESNGEPTSWAPRARCAGRCFRIFLFPRSAVLGFSAAASLAFAGSIITIACVYGLARVGVEPRPCHCCWQAWRSALF